MAEAAISLVLIRISESGEWSDAQSSHSTGGGHQTRAETIHTLLYSMSGSSVSKTLASLM
jgi:hypothetical protein